MGKCQKEVILTSTSSVKRSSGTRNEPCRAMATKLIPIAVNSTAATLQEHPSVLLTLLKVLTRPRFNASMHRRS